MRVLRVLCVLCVLCGGYLAFAAAPGPAPIFGFTPRSTSAERALERRFLALPSPEKARDAHAFLTAEPHVAGSPRDRALAEWVRDRWREAGLEQVEIVEHEVLLPYATDVEVELIAGSERNRPATSRWHASLKEEPVPGDPATSRDIGVPYHAYSASGEATAPVVYAGGGNPADYDWLAARGIDIKGKIALVRYSVPYSYRGFKALTAEQRGAAGILIYSDPADDGAGKGKTFPDGPWGPESHIQRGGVVYDFMVPGDPLTPGWASVPGARRIAAKDAISLPKIMSVPLSWKDARPILEALNGPEAPREWQGGGGFAYRVGGSDAVAIHMRVRMDDKIRPIWTVTGRLTGTTHPDELVVVGNHRDAWVYGGVDPSSGTASMIELVRSLGSLPRPKRTIVFANWDAEEFTLTSSTEWGEQHESDLAAHAVAYINVDSSTSGPSFTASAVPSLNRLIAEAAAEVTDPATGQTIAAATRAAGPRGGGALPTAGGSDLVSNRLGSGSDYTVFLNFLGVPVIDMSFTGPYGVYHSIYDDHLWMSKFGDPGYRYHAAMARLWGLMALRLANADIVPLECAPYAKRIREFVDELAARARPEDESAFARLVAAADRFTKAATALDRAVEHELYASDADGHRDPQALSRALMQMERAFTDPAGIPGRPWYRHLIYAPRPTYAPEVLPGVAEALDAGDRARIAEQAARVAAALDRATALLTAK
jgi:N-acetylated-alpha-linked acidic dipeptidase